MICQLGSRFFVTITFSPTAIKRLSGSRFWSSFCPVGPSLFVATPILSFNVSGCPHITSSAFDTYNWLPMTPLFCLLATTFHCFLTAWQGVTRSACDHIPVKKSVVGHLLDPRQSVHNNDKCSAEHLPCWAWWSKSSQPASVTLTCSLRMTTPRNFLYSLLPIASSFESSLNAGQYRGADLHEHTGGNWWKSPHMMTFIPPNGMSSACPQIWLKIRLNVVEICVKKVCEIMEYSSMIRYQTFCHMMTSLFIIEADGWPPFTGTPHNECSVAPPNHTGHYSSISTLL